MCYFIDSEQGKEFTKIAEYVNKNRILIDKDMAEYPDDNGCFYHVNFGDYHIYRLIDGRIDSPYITETIKRIFCNTADNPFFEKYKYCSRCSLKDCPVKRNYEMLQYSNIAEGLTNVVIETIVKEKMILSTRDLLNFFYDIIVHPEFEKVKYANSKKNIYTKRHCKLHNTCREDFAHNKAEEESVLSHGDDDNAVMCKIFRHICVICNVV